MPAVRRELEDERASSRGDGAGGKGRLPIPGEPGERSKAVIVGAKYDFKKVV